MNGGALMNGGCADARQASPRPVAIWHDLDSSGDLVSELGRIDGTALAHREFGHCSHREHCSIVREPLGRCILFSDTIRSSLDQRVPSVWWNFHASITGDLVTLGVDHAGAEGRTETWTYRLLPLRWRNVDPPELANPPLLLGVWPD